MEISKILLDVASDDLEQPDKLRSLLKDLREARQAKSREGLKQLDHSELSVYSLPLLWLFPQLTRLYSYQTWVQWKLMKSDPTLSNQWVYYQNSLFRRNQAFEADIVRKETIVKITNEQSFSRESYPMRICARNISWKSWAHSFNYFSFCKYRLHSSTFLEENRNIRWTKEMQEQENANILRYSTAKSSQFICVRNGPTSSSAGFQVPCHNCHHDYSRSSVRPSTTQPSETGFRRYPRKYSASIQKQYIRNMNAS